MSCEGFCLRRVAKDVVWVRWSDAGVDAGAEGVVVVVSSEGLWWPWWAFFFLRGVWRVWAFMVVVFVLHDRVHDSFEGSFFFPLSFLPLPLFFC